VFRRMREARALSRAPVAEAFLQGRNLRLMLAALFGAAVGQAVTFYVGTFYAYYFLERVARVDGLTVSVLTAVALVIGAPLVVAAGWLSDRVGRKPPVLAAAALAALLYFPLFGALLQAANPALAEAREASPVVVRAAAGDCSLQFDPLGRARYDQRSCDVVKSYLARAGIDHATAALPGPGPARLEVGAAALSAPGAAALAGPHGAELVEEFRAAAGRMLESAGYGAAERAAVDVPRVIAILVALLAIAAGTTGAYAALLAELFPARIRYTALSFSQNVGSGWFGGLLPAIAFTIVAATGDVFSGLWYPVGLAALSFLVGWLALPETRGRELG
jgi:Sugar (and other) transporter